ncbi:unnamed protein product [Oncorhynchus mykiss]|uniref:Cytosolic fatty-acid binding proteins domain-containing protein n=1 Tax=Oncorhynchus mykiss TaxID=8022 RepID=A0A060WBX8_ONCMY|nr:unnamed protein product [Oncorhynchus mykiss]
MSFSGKYQMESHDNFESFMEAVGLPDELIQEGKDIKSISEIEETGDHFKVTVTTGTKILTNSFTIGQETELESPTGEKVNVSGACHNPTMSFIHVAWVYPSPYIYASI